MKICPECNSGNNDKSLQCKDCGRTLLDTKIEESQDYVQKILDREEKTHKRNMLIHTILLLLVAPLYLYLFSKAISNIGVVFPVFTTLVFLLPSYFYIHKPRVFFVISHIFTIENIDKVELTDWYIFTSKLAGVISIIVSYALLVYPELMK